MAVLAVPALVIGSGSYGVALRGPEGLATWRFGACLTIILLLAIEIALDRFLTLAAWRVILSRGVIPIIPFILVGLGPSWLDLSRWPPPQHLYAVRQAQMAWGLIFVAHLLLYVIPLGRRALRARRVAPSTVFGVLAVFLFLGTMTQTLRASTTGDEPHYLLVMESLVRDGDLDLENQFLNGDWKKFHDRSELKPQDVEEADNDGRRISKHPIGLSLLGLPGYVAAGRFGVAAMLTVLAALGLWWTLRALESIGFGPHAVTMTGWTGLLASPLWFFAGNVFAEVPAAALWALSFMMATRKRWDWAALAAGATLWFHPRNGFALAGVWFAIVVMALAGALPWRKALRPLVVAMVPLSLLAVFNALVFHGVSVHSAYGNRIGEGFGAGYLLPQLFGHLTDQESGLWIYFPVMLAVPAGIVVALHSRPAWGRVLSFALIFTLLGLGSYFYLGGPPPCRFLVPVTPFLLFSLAHVLERMERIGLGRRIWLAATTVSCLVGALFAAIPWLKFSQSGEAWVWQLFRSALGIDLPAFLPSFYLEPVPLRSYLWAVPWFLVAIGLALWSSRYGRTSGRRS